MRTFFLALCLFFSHSIITIAQVPAPDFDCPPLPILFKATGQASGHIGDLTISNTCKADVTFPGGPIYIPSEGQYQPYIVPFLPSIPIGPGKEVTIPANGYCTDVHLPPPPMGTTIYLPDDIRPGDRISNSLPDPNLLDALNRIISVATQTYNSDGITDHFVISPEKEKEVVIQQTFWIHTSSLAGKPYGFNEFCKTTTDQFSPMDEGTTTPAGSMDRALQTDISKLWRNIVEVGTKAGIPAFLQLPFPTFNPPTETTPIESAYPDILNFVTATGTGRTTGHIADLTVTNPTNRPLVFTFGPGSLPFDGKPLPPGKSIPTGPACFIPSSGGYQPYIMPSFSPIMLEGGQTKTVPLNGYCVDIHRPPVPSGTGMPPISDWIVPSPYDPQSVDQNFTWSIPADKNTVKSEIRIAVCPTDIAMPLNEAIQIIVDSRPPAFPYPKSHIPGSTASTPDDNCMPSVFTPGPTVPGSNTPLEVTVNPDRNPKLAVPLLLDAITRISKTYDDLKGTGQINTPFSGNPEKEREAVIQQTLWLYAAELSGSKYDKNDFRDQTVKQFENNMGTPFTNAAQPQQDKVNQGVTDFWDTFEAVGVEAKILSVPVDVPSVPVPELQKGWENYNTTQAKVL